MKITLFIMLCIIELRLHSELKIIFSAALTNSYFEYRKQEYIKSLNIIKDFGYENIYIVEALCKNGPTFLDNYSTNVFYSTANNPNFRNQGTNEARTCLQGTFYFNFEPNDMILKLTGRHHFISDYFIKLVENNPSYDAFVKLDSQRDVYTVCFAMKCKYFQEMYEHMDFNLMERNWINLETMVGNYIKQKVAEGSFKVCYVDKLDVLANNYGSSTAPGAPHNIIIF